MPEEEKKNNKDVFVADAVEYLVDLIINLFGILFKGGELSRKGVNTLLLFFLTAFLIQKHTELPMSIKGVISLYWIPLIFLSYFLIDALQNIDRINKIFRKLQQKTDVAYEDIMYDKVANDNVENYLGSISFETEQIKNIINHLREHNQFTRYAQYTLLLRSSKFSSKTDGLIQESLIKEGWDPVAICIYVKQKRFNLDDSFIKKLSEKYNNEPGVIFNIGRYQHFMNVADINKKYLNAGQNLRSSTKLFNFLYLSFLAAPFLYAIIYLKAPFDEKEVVLLWIISTFLVIGVLLFNWVSMQIVKFRVKKSLKKENM